MGQAVEFDVRTQRREREVVEWLVEGRGAEKMWLSYLD